MSLIKDIILFILKIIFIIISFGLFIVLCMGSTASYKVQLLYLIFFLLFLYVGRYIFKLLD
jgi:hypothetical protein